MEDTMPRITKPRRRPRLTLEVEPETRAALVDWAREEARPVGNLVRRLLGTVVSERRQQTEERAA
jgi:hypothetical protein